MEKRFAGRKALVTGGARRLGREFSLALAREGCDVVVHYGNSAADAADTVENIQALGSRGTALQADLSQHQSVLDFAQRAADAFGGLDIVVNSASTYSSSDKLIAEHSFLEETFEEWERSMAVNARAPFFLIQQLAPTLKAGTEPCVVNILDRSISTPYKTRAAHSISKSAFLAVSRMMSISLAPDVRVNALEFGGMLPGDEMPTAEERRIQWGGSNDAVSALLFVLTTKFVSGEVIGVKGNSILFDG